MRDWTPDYWIEQDTLLNQDIAEGQLKPEQKSKILEVLSFIPIAGTIIGIKNAIAAYKPEFWVSLLETKGSRTLSSSFWLLVRSPI